MEQNKETCLVSIIIVNHNNSEQQLRACTDSLKLHLSELSFEVILVHNGLNPIKLPECKNICSENKGFGQANNLAASIAKGKYFLFLNPDTVWLKGNLREAIKAFEKNQKSGVCGFRLIESDGKVQPWSAGKKISLFDILLNNIGLARSKKVWLSSTTTDAGWVSGAALFISKECFNEINGFDDSFFLYFEDVDLCQRAKNNGYIVFYFPHITISHAGGTSMTNSAKQKEYYYKSQDHYFQKHHSKFSQFFLKLLRFLFH